MSTKDNDEHKHCGKDIGHTVGAVSRYDLEYLKYYLPDVTAEVIHISCMFKVQ